MAKVEFRLGSTIVFDSEKEKDLIDLVERASKQHKLGELLSHLLRMYSETPEKLKEPTNEITKSLVEMSKYGLTPKRYEFFNQVSKEIEDMKCKVDTIYDMCFKMYTLAQFGKRIGLEGKSNNMLMAEFMLEKQLTDLCDKLGIDNVRHTFSSNKLETAQQKSADVLEYILETYDSIVNELKETIFKEIELKVKPLDIEVKPSVVSESMINGNDSSNNISALSGNNPTGKVIDNNGVNNQATNEKKEEQSEDEYIDFGNADIEALSNFFGE